MSDSHPIYSSIHALNAVEQWAQGCLLIREIGLVPNRRLDGVLVPLAVDAVGLKNSTRRKGPDGFPVDWFSRHGLIGLEVKISGADFKRGLTEGQFEDYADNLIGLYIVTTIGVCKTAEIPKRHGHLVVSRTRGGTIKCVCKRNPKWEIRQPTHEQLWRILDRGYKVMREKVERLSSKTESEIEMIRQRVEEEVMVGVREIVKQVRSGDSDDPS